VVAYPPKAVSTDPKKVCRTTAYIFEPENAPSRIRHIANAGERCPLLAGHVCSRSAMRDVRESDKQQTRRGKKKSRQVALKGLGFS
jgi:hypothetical protein